MGLLNIIRKSNLFPGTETTSTQTNDKQHFVDWTATTEQHRGYYSALTLSKNIRGAALSFRCRPKDRLELFTLSIPGTSSKLSFEKNKNYKVRLHFSNSIILYASLHAYEKKHAVIAEIADDFLENLFDSESLQFEFYAEGSKKTAINFSLTGATAAIESAIQNCIPVEYPIAS